jgi:hypothetical protein
MSTSARLRAAASFLVITIAAACGSDSTGPSQSPSSVAEHFDSLYVQANDLAESNGAYGFRSLLLTFFEVPPAFGANPSTISVTTASGVEHWKAFEFVDVGPPGTDSGFVFLAYRESPAHTMLLIPYNGDGTSAGATMITNDTLIMNVTVGSDATSLTSTSTACGTPSASLVNPQLPSFTISTCKLAKFLTSFSITSQTSASIDPALASISLNAASVNGIRLLHAPEAATLRRARAALHAARTCDRL